MQRLPDPGMNQTSQEGGGTVHSNALAMSAPGSAPGYDAGTMTYPVSTDAPVPAALAPIRVSNEAGRDPVLPGSNAGSAPITQAGLEDQGNAGLWKKTPSAS